MTGRFLQTDPVPGGSASAYDYCNADPVNCTDLGGTFTWKGLAKAVAVVAETASMFVPGPVGAAVGALAAGAHLAAGDKDAAKMAAIGAAATLVGAGLAVAAVKAARVVKTAQTLGRLATRGAQKVARVAGAANQAAKERYALSLATRYNGGRSRVVVLVNRDRKMAIDLIGKSHFDKTIQRYVPTPHYYEYIRHPLNPTREWSRGGSRTWGATWTRLIRTHVQLARR
ncbi:hypothetical protein [Cellulomonas soli]